MNPVLAGLIGGAVVLFILFLVGLLWAVLSLKKSIDHTAVVMERSQGVFSEILTNKELISSLRAFPLLAGQLPQVISQIEALTGVTRMFNQLVFRKGGATPEVTAEDESKAFLYTDERAAEEERRGRAADVGIPPTTEEETFTPPVAVDDAGEGRPKAVVDFVG